jgi:hypothetical protein
MSERVTVDNFKRAETDYYFGNFGKGSALGKFAHRREPTAIDKQDVIRMNRDTLYSSATPPAKAGSHAVHVSMSVRVLAARSERCRDLLQPDTKRCPGDPIEVRFRSREMKCPVDVLVPFARLQAQCR